MLCVIYLHIQGSIAYSHRYRHLKPILKDLINTLSVLSMIPYQVIGEMVLDGGGRFSPAGIVGVHTLSLFLSSQAAHDRAAEVTGTHRLEYTRMCVCVYSSHPFWTSSSLDVPAGVTQEEGHTGFLIHLPSAVRALIFVARRIQPFLSLVDREVEFCVLTN